MATIKPTFSEDDFAGKNNENYGKPVPEGEYPMVIKKATLRESQNGNPYLSVQLNHTGDFSGSKPAFAVIMLNGGKRLALLLTALGLGKDDKDAVEFTGDETCATLMVRGDAVTMEDRAVLAKLELDEYDGKERNTVAYIAPARD